MDGQRFDEMTIALGTRRRAVLGALLAGGLGAVLGRTPAEAGPPACKAPGQVCTKRGDCCATPCKKKRGKKQGRCKACGGGRAYCNGVCCAAGEDCRGGACTCAGASCPGGCCGGGTICVSPPTDAQCGTNGAACVACATGQRCQGGACVCDDQSCAGCCAGTSCVPTGQQTDGQCGSGGGACEACTAPATCFDGACCTPDCASKCGGEDDGCGGNCTCAAGRECVHGGCFQITSGLECPGCSPTCSEANGNPCITPNGACCSGSVDGSGNFLCVTFTRTPCQGNADCPLGQACQANGVCRATC